MSTIADKLEKIENRLLVIETRFVSAEKYIKYLIIGVLSLLGFNLTDGL